MLKKIVYTIITLSIILSSNVGAIDELFYSQNNIVLYNPEDTVCSESPSGDETTGPSGGTPSKSLTDFVEKYAGAAIATHKAYGISYEAILAQAAHESGMGRSKLTTQYNNFFGIKAGSSWKGKIGLMRTAEQKSNGQVYYVMAKFRAYSSPEEGFLGYGEFISSLSRYKKALSVAEDPFKYAEELRNAGYATDISYVKKFHATIRQVQAITSKDRTKYPDPSTIEIDPTARRATSEPLGLNGSSNPCEGSSGGSVGASEFAQRVIQIAHAEYAKKPQEYDKTVYKYTTGRQEAWCADFVSWVYKEAGKPIGGNRGWQVPGTLTMQAIFKKKYRYFKAGTEQPRPGDIAFYFGSQTPDEGSKRHVNLVMEVNGDKMVTIGGNEGDTIKKGTRSTRFGAGALHGFGRIE